MSITGWEDIRGWFGDTDANLYDMSVKKFPDGSRFVEVGCWHGRSSLAMVDCIIRNNKQICFYCVDHFNGSEENKQEPSVIANTVFEEYCKNIEPHKEYIKTVRLSSEEACLGFEDNSLDFVYIDASHEYEHVSKDLDIWHKKIKPGGILSGHDWGWPIFNHAVQRAVINFAKQNNYVIHNEFDNSWYLYKK